MRIIYAGCGLFFLQIKCYRSLGSLRRCSVQLAAPGRFQCRNSCANLLAIATRIRFVQCARGVQHSFVVRAHGGSSLLTLGALAVKHVVDRLPESVPQFLFLLALNRHALRFLLPALLQVFDGVNAHHGLLAQCSGLVNHGMAAGQAGGLRGI